LQPIKKRSRLEIDKENAQAARLAEVKDQAKGKKGVVMMLM
jgi:hypothetical protein